jgi:uncharacterized protein (DUF1697 family)
VTIHIALLRAVNIAGHNKVRMSDLRDLFTALGMQDVQTVLQSGNVVFRSARRDAGTLERLLERETAKRLGVGPDYFVRTADEWSAVVGENPFPREAERDPSHFAVVFLKDAPDRKAVSALRHAINGREMVEVVGRHLYAVYPDGFGRSKLTTNVIEKHIDTRGTARNWNTVLKLGTLAGVR